MTLSYKNEFKDFLNHYDLLNHGQTAAARNAYIRSLLPAAGIGALGIFGSYPSSLFVVCLLVAATGMYLSTIFSFSDHYQSRIEASVADLPEKEIELEVKEDGLFERMECGVESLCPWGSIIGYHRFRDTLFVEMKSQLWAIIPAHSLSPDSAGLADLVRQFEEHGICEIAESNGPDQTP